MATLWTIPEMWKDDYCIIIGGGPSINKIPNFKELIKDKNVIGCNDAYIYDPTICLFGDTRWYNHHKSKQEFIDYNGLKVTCSTDGKDFKDPDILYLKNLARGVSTNRNTLAFNGNTGAAAINLALLLGCRMIFLFGFDMKHDENGNSNWHPNISTVSFRKYNYYKDKLDNVAEKMYELFPNCQIYNCNEDSALNTFNKISIQLMKEFYDYKDKTQEELYQMSIQMDHINLELIGQDEILYEKPIVMSVLKSGGQYEYKHVKSLRNQLKQNTSIPFDFKFFSDLDIDDPDLIKLENNLPGWHSKIEMFKYNSGDRPVTFFDLDTIILKNIDNIIQHNNVFAGLQDFNRKDRFASGMMQWTEQPKYLVCIIDKIKKIVNSKNWKQIWDQKLIELELRNKRIRWGRLQLLYSKQILSYKCDHIDKSNIIPDTCKILCFHGEPRPWNVERFKYLYDEGL